MFDSALATESELGIDRWSQTCPDIDELSMTVLGAEPFVVQAALTGPARAVDQRIKCATWAEEFAAAGGNLIVHSAEVTDLEEYAITHDLVVVASGRGDIGRLFPPDHERSPFDRPQRVVALTYVNGMQQPTGKAAIRYTFVPDVGEFFTFPALTTTGPCDIMVFEGLPAGPMDCWDDVTDPESHLERSLELLEKFVPDEFERCAHVRLTDAGGTLRGRFTPRVRVPVATLPSGKPVLAMGDSVVLNDPITGQGANLAAKAATYYLESINRTRGGVFDEAWMRGTFENFWRGWAHWVVDWTNSMLVGHSLHQTDLLREAAQAPALASAIASGFDDPREFYQWWFDAEAATRFRAEKRIGDSGRFDLRALRGALGQYATGVAVITARAADGRRVGMTANSFTSVSMDPPLVLWCPGKNAPSLPAFTEATHFAINVLGAHQEHLSRQFSTPAADKFSEIELVDGKGGTPTLPGAVARFECRMLRSFDAGDHVIVLGEVEHFESPGGSPLIFHAGALRAGSW